MLKDNKFLGFDLNYLRACYIQNTVKTEKYLMLQVL